MTTTTTGSNRLMDGPPRPSARLRFLIAFVIGLAVAMLVGVGAMYAYDRHYEGRVLPGITIGAVDLSGLDSAAAGARLQEAYGGLATGQVVLAGPHGKITIPYAEIGRRADVESMVAAAMAVGRTGHPVERAVSGVRTAVRGVALPPRVTHDADALASRIAQALGNVEQRPVAAFVFANADGDYEVLPSRDGRQVDIATPTSTALQAVGELDAPATIDVAVPVTTLEPSVTTAEAEAVKAQAERMTAPIALVIEGVDKPQTVTSAQLREWTRFSRTGDGGYTVTVDTSDLPALLKKLAKKIDKAPVNATFRTSGSTITGVVPSTAGYKLDVAATAAKVETLLGQRADGQTATALAPALKVTEPALTTAEAKAARPKMRRVGPGWTTYFPITIKNGFGANIWTPARLINGYVVAPHATFDFWKAVGPVTRAKGFRQGGAIINGRTEPQGALAGGICSCSTTLFNAALRAGYEMGARRNHYYYIDRYPVGLDATVFISASGSTQTMSFTNDTDYPILIRGRGWRNGNAGYVRFELYSVPTGRKVQIITGRKHDYRPASDTVQYTSSLRPGVRERVEYPVDGFKVSATRIVRDRNGKIIHKNTWFSNYSRVTGIVLVGKGASKPAATPAPAN